MPAMPPPTTSTELSGLLICFPQRARDEFETGRGGKPMDPHVGRDPPPDGDDADQNAGEQADAAEHAPRPRHAERRQQLNAVGDEAGVVGHGGNVGARIPLPPRRSGASGSAAGAI